MKLAFGSHILLHSETGAYADLLLVDGDPAAGLSLIGDPGKNFRIIMKDGRIFKNTL